MADNLFNFPTLQAGSMQTPNLQGVSPYDPMITGGFAGGPMAGTFFNDYQNAVGRNERASDLEYQNAENTFQNTLADNPLRQSQRDITAMDQQVQKYLYASGQKQQQAEIGVQADISKNIALQSSAQLQEMNNHLEGMTQIAGMVKGNPNFLNDEEAQAQVGEFAKQNKITGVPTKWTPSDVAHVQRVADAAVGTRELRQKQQLLNQGYTYDVGRENAAQGIGRIPLETWGHMQQAMATNAAAAQMEISKKPIDEQIQIGILNKAMSGGTVTESDIHRFESTYFDRLKADPQYATQVASVKTSVSGMSNSVLQATAKANGIDPNQDRSALKSAVETKLIAKKVSQLIQDYVGPKLDGIPFNGSDGKEYSYQNTTAGWLPKPTGRPNQEVKAGTGINQFGTGVGTAGGVAGASGINPNPTVPNQPPSNAGLGVLVREDATGRTGYMKGGKFMPIGNSPQPQVQPAAQPQPQAQPQAAPQPQPQPQAAPVTSNSTASTSITDMERVAGADPSIVALKREIDKETAKGANADVEHQKALITAINAIRKNKYGLQ